MDIPTIAAIVGPLGTALFFMYKVIDKRFDKLDSEIKDMKYDIKSIDQRISRMEGLERGHWEGRMYSLQKSTEEKK